MAINPYQAPTSAPESAPFSSPGEPYVDQGDRVRLLGGLLIVSMLVAVGSVASTWLEIDLLERAKQGLMTMEEAEANDERQQLVALGAFAVFVLTAVIFAMFLHRANKNARALSGQPLSDSPGWTVGWFFVPFANLYKPYQSVREIWERSKGAAPLPFTLWWVAYIGGGVLSWISLRMRDPNSIESMISSDGLAIVQELVGIASAGLALWMVRSLHQGQQRHHQTGQPQVPMP